MLRESPTSVPQARLTFSTSSLLSYSLMVFAPSRAARCDNLQARIHTRHQLVLVLQRCLHMWKVVGCHRVNLVDCLGDLTRSLLEVAAHLPCEKQQCRPAKNMRVPVYPLERARNRLQECCY